jgi:hypothetical protein
MVRASALCVLSLMACGDDGAGKLPDAPAADDARTDDGNVAIDTLVDAAPRVYNCGAFTEAPTWTITTGFRAVVIADAADGLAQPVAAIVAGGAFDGKIYVVNQTDDTLRAVEPTDGTTTTVVAAAAWPRPAALLTTITWDAQSLFDGNLYVGDQGGDGDGDSTIFRVAPNGTPTTFVTAPGPGLDDIYGMAFSTNVAYGNRLYVTGDTDGAGVDWGSFDSTGAATNFSELAGAEGIAFDTSTGAMYGGGLLASRPAGGGYAGDDTITKIDTAGAAAGTVIAARPGIHAVTVAPPGPFGGKVVFASWSTGELVSVDAQGIPSVLASGLSLTNYDGNILAFSPDGNVLYVADRLANRLVCIEPEPFI